ncbi:FMN reductase [Kribbella sp. NPDC026611]|uniref:FMN reductase n=1 Tax=Kribbella sp. NPDC026611 TaxID=3154911 RepID=UPI0034018DFE
MNDKVIAVVTAGLTTPSSSRLLADQLATAVQDELSGRGLGSRVELIEVRDHARDLTNNLLTGFPTAELQKVLDTVTAADALVVVSPTFSASYSGLFKMFFDVLDDQALAGKPVLLGATGGTERHSLVLDFALRPLFAYLKALPVATGVYAASTDWGPGAAKLHSRIAQAASEIGAALQHETPTKADPFDNPTPFEDLLNG